MQKLHFTQQLLQKLSPQQIQFIKLLQLPTIELESRIEEELEINPALEEGKEYEGEEFDETFSNQEDDFEDTDNDTSEDINIDDYLKEEDYGYKMAGDGANLDDDDKETPIVGATTLIDNLVLQVGYLRLDDLQTIIANQLVGSIESDGYIRRELDAIVNDLAFGQNIITDVDEVESVLLKIQSLDPPGIGARSLQECLQIQLERKDQLSLSTIVATQIIENFFDEFTKKHYDKIQKKLEISDEQLKKAIDVITKLNPKPGSSVGSGGMAVTIIPDFILINEGGDLVVTLNSRNAPELRISRDYSEMLKIYDKSDKKDKKLKETVNFVKQKLENTMPVFWLHNDQLEFLKTTKDNLVASVVAETFTYPSVNVVGVIEGTDVNLKKEFVLLYELLNNSKNQ